MKRSLLLLAMLTLLAPAARADEAVFSSGGNPLPPIQIKVLKIEDGKLFYRSTSSGKEGERELDQVIRLKIDDEPGFNSAEEAYAGKQFQPAMDGYLKALRTSDKVWLKDRAATRLIELAQKANKLDVVISAYTYLVTRDPKTAAAFRPAITEGLPGLDTAAAEISKALGDPKLNEEKRTALLTLLLDVHRARKDTRAQGETIEQLQKYNTNLGNDPAAARTMADLTLSIARTSLDQKKFEKVLSDIEGKKQTFIDPGQQVEALFLIAEAKNGIDGESKDANKQKDLALAYMRVAALSKDLQNHPHLHEALYNAGTILEKINETGEALRLYRDAAKTESPVAGKAKEAIARLSK